MVRSSTSQARRSGPVRRSTGRSTPNERTARSRSVRCPLIRATRIRCPKISGVRRPLHRIASLATDARTRSNPPDVVLRSSTNSTGCGVGWRGRIRTFDLLIQSQAPYRLATRQWSGRHSSNLPSDGPQASRLVLCPPCHHAAPVPSRRVRGGGAAISPPFSMRSSPAWVTWPAAVAIGRCSSPSRSSGSFSPPCSSD